MATAHGTHLSYNIGWTTNTYCAQPSPGFQTEPLHISTIKPEDSPFLNMQFGIVTASSGKWIDDALFDVVVMEAWDSYKPEPPSYQPKFNTDTIEALKKKVYEYQSGLSVTASAGGFGPLGGGSNPSVPANFNQLVGTDYGHITLQQHPAQALGTYQLNSLTNQYKPNGNGGL